MENKEHKPVAETPQPPTEWRVVYVEKTQTTVLVPDKPVEENTVDGAVK